MLAIKIDLLTERYVATRFNDRDATEWPPHPARLYSALVATWAETGADPATRAALTWFEALDSPEIQASRAARRSPVIFYVPDADVRVSEQVDRLYGQLTDKAREIATLAATIQSEGATPQQEKHLARLVRELDKLRQTASVDSTKKTAIGRSETDNTTNRGLAALPEHRSKQGRTFPTIIPEDPAVYFIWSDVVAPADHRQRLEALLHQVSRLGHSSSLVSCELVDDPPAANLVPDSAGSQLVRVTTAGLLDELEDSFARHQGTEPRSLPAIIQRYRLLTGTPPRPLPPRPVFGQSWTLLRVRERPLPLSQALSLTAAVRGALQRHGQDPLPELLTGHEPSADGRPTPPSSRPHLAIAALPFVGGPHADGGIRGVALIFPEEVDSAGRLAVEYALDQWSNASGGSEMHVQLGRAGLVKLERTDSLTAIASLREGTWCRASTTWDSATPVALDRFVGPLWHGDPAKHAKAEGRAVEIVKEACSYIGLPRPRAVQILKAGPLAAVPAVGSFPIYQSPGRGVRRQSVHVRIEFDAPVGGPVLLGAGRYFGYGLCLPVVSSGRQDADTTTPEMIAR
jgi:CRISPR-associated protein Csb2